MKPLVIQCPHCGETAATVVPSQRQLPQEPSLVGDFLRDRCTLTPGARTLTTDLQAAFRDWVATTLRIDPPSSKLVGIELRNLGIQVARSNGARYYEGVHLRQGSDFGP